MRNVLNSAILTMGLVAATPPASAQKSADTLRISYQDSLPDVTPYYNQQRVGIVIGHHVWDSLVTRPGDLPAQAIACRIVQMG